MEPLARSIFFGPKLILKVSTVPNQFNGSISKSAVNLEKIGRGQIFGLSRDYPLTSRPDRAKISHFQNLFRFIQYGCRSFSIDAGSDPTKFQDDWPSGSRLIGAWSSDFAFNVFVCQVEPLARSIFFGRKLILKVSTVPNQFNGSISKSAVNLEKIGRGQIFGLSRDTPSPPGQIGQKLAIFKTCSDSFNMGVVRSVLMPVVTLPSFKMIGRLEVG